MVAPFWCAPSGAQIWCAPPRGVTAIKCHCDTLKTDMVIFALFLMFCICRIEDFQQLIWLNKLSFEYYLSFVCFKHQQAHIWCLQQNSPTQRKLVGSVKPISFCGCEHILMAITVCRNLCCSLLAMAVELEPKSFRWWSRSLKFGFRFHRHSLLGKQEVQTIQWFLVFIWTKSFLSRSQKL